MKSRIYISGPITKGDREANFQQAADAQKALLAAGYAVLNPVLTMLLPGAFEIPHDTWIANDLPWVAVADAVLRLPGESEGADIECTYASDRGIPVFCDLDKLRAEAAAMFVQSRLDCRGARGTGGDVMSTKANKTDRKISVKLRIPAEIHCRLKVAAAVEDGTIAGTAVRYLDRYLPHILNTTDQRG